MTNFDTVEIVVLGRNGGVKMEEDSEVDERRSIIVSIRSYSDDNEPEELSCHNNNINN